ncbi:hypothetical protein EV426DRAFT_577146 [Tirmania nivea]|nr:hypothetical protein EV426DRAFT_577146 [Tirmania nivea]
MPSRYWITRFKRTPKADTSAHTDNEKPYVDTIKGWVIKVKCKLINKPKAKYVQIPNEGNRMISEATRGQTPCLVAEYLRNNLEPSEPPNIEEAKPQAPPAHGPPKKARSSTPHPANDPRSPRKKIVFSPRPSTATEASLQLVLTRSSEHAIPDAYPLCFSGTLLRPDAEQEHLSRPDSPTLAPVTEEGPVEQCDRPRPRSQIELPTLTGRYVRSKSENWVLYDLDVEQELGSGSD